VDGTACVRREGDRLTEAELSQYKAIKDEIDDLSFRIKQLQEQKLQIHTTKVKGSISDFPYIEAHFNVTGPDYDEQNRRQIRINELIRKREVKRTELIEKESDLHDFIYSIQESEIRQIFTLRFIEDLGYEEIGRKLHMDRTTVAKKIRKYLDD
jgi:DNA-directed RNA polymerase specialized sigma24 family protein